MEKGPGEGPGPGFSGLPKSDPQIGTLVEALTYAQSRARESERLVSDYDNRFHVALRVLNQYVEEGHAQVLEGQRRVRLVEEELAEAQRLKDTEEAVLRSIDHSLAQLRQQAAILEMEYERRKLLRAQLDIFSGPLMNTSPPSIPATSSAPSLSHIAAPSPRVSVTAVASLPLAPAPAPPSTALPVRSSHGNSPSSPGRSPIPSPWPTPAISPRPSPSPTPDGVGSLAELDAPRPERSESEVVRELYWRLQAAEGRAREAEEERTALELRMRALVAVLDDDYRSARDLRSLLEKSVDGRSVVLPSLDQRVQMLRQELNSMLQHLVRWLLSFFLPGVLD